MAIFVGRDISYDPGGRADLIEVTNAGNPVPARIKVTRHFDQYVWQKGGLRVIVNAVAQKPRSLKVSSPLHQPMGSGGPLCLGPPIICVANTCVW